MAITFDETSKIFTLTTARSAYQMQVGRYGVLLHLYYGAPVGNTGTDYLLRGMDRGFSGNPYEADGDRTFSLDTLPQEYPAFGAGDYRGTCLRAVYPDGSSDSDLRYVRHEIFAGKPALCSLPAVYAGEQEAQSLRILLRDGTTGLEVELLYSVLEEYDAITRAAVIHNATSGPVRLEQALSCCLDFPNESDGLDIITFYGRHTFERAPERTPVRHGKIVADSLRGASSHQQNPFLIACDHEANEEYGRCWGMALVYSGNFLAQAELDQISQLRLSMGIHPQGFCWNLGPGECFTAPETILCYSGEGLDRLSGCYHRLYREHLCRGEWKHRPRPVLINNWEATYFDFDDGKLVQIAEEASKLGIDMLVMDDGWFGRRDSDTSSLGDWTVNEGKIRCGLGELARRVNALGMRLGIWFEPEMVSQDSELYRAHPEWTLLSPGRRGVRSRFQYVLDMSRQDVRDYLYDALSAVLRSANIEYVKWDMNRHLTNVYSALLPPQRQGEVCHRYVLGLYELLERLTGDFPHVLFEGCSGGGGRFDPGMLYYFPQIWCSDDTDAVERVKIQYGTSFGYPVSAVGSHVSACPNHQTGRVTPLSTRGVVAMAGTFGYELDLSKLTVEEKALAARQVADFRRWYDVIQYGDYHRLTDPFQNDRYAAWLFVSPGRERALLCYVQLRAQANPPIHTLRLRGLDPKRTYTLTLGDEKLTCSGAALHHAGLSMPALAGDNQALQIEITAQ